MRFAAQLLAATLCLSIAACVKVVDPGSASGGRSEVSNADGGSVTSPEDDSPTCDQVCAPLECADGMHPAPLSGECCPATCEPDDCSLVDCPALGCPVGSRPVKSRGSCCSVCAREPATVAGETCERGQAGYDSFFEQMVAGLGANLCNADGNCRITVIDNRCSHGCGIAVAARVASTLKANLDDYAATHCTSCPTSGTPCPEVEHVAFCTGGVCSAH
jgi:hypothetical protein